jgi:hypothetical protein
VVHTVILAAALVVFGVLLVVVGLIGHARRPAT